jgi:hypothetical protein
LLSVSRSIGTNRKSRFGWGGQDGTSAIGLGVVDAGGRVSMAVDGDASRLGVAGLLVAVGTLPEQAARISAAASARTFIGVLRTKDAT